MTDRVDPNVATFTTIEIDMPALNEHFKFPFEISNETELILESSAGFSSSPILTHTSPTSPTPSSSSTLSSSSNLSILEDELRPFPKAGPRTVPKTNGQRKRTSAVLTLQSKGSSKLIKLQ